MNEQKKPRKNRSAGQVAEDAAIAAELSAAEMEAKARIARNAATQAENFARLARVAFRDGKLDVASNHAKRAIQEAQTAADAASLIL